MDNNFNLDSLDFEFDSGDTDSESILDELFNIGDGIEDEDTIEDEDSDGDIETIGDTEEDAIPGNEPDSQPDTNSSIDSPNLAPAINPTVQGSSTTSIRAIATKKSTASAQVTRSSHSNKQTSFDTGMVILWCVMGVLFLGLLLAYFIFRRRYKRLRVRTDDIDQNSVMKPTASPRYSVLPPQPIPDEIDIKPFISPYYFQTHTSPRSDSLIRPPDAKELPHSMLESGYIHRIALGDEGQLTQVGTVEVQPTIENIAALESERGSVGELELDRKHSGQSVNKPC
jgi:hypothetical protein